MSRTLQVFILFALSPLIGEVLLGNLSPSKLESFIAFPLLALLYGGGAVFIRELARRTGRGWPTIITLALAYGVLEESMVTQTLFNPEYQGLRLLDYGAVPVLGTGAPWAVYVLGIHTLWSIAVPIALTEAMVPCRERAPWLGRFGLTVSGLLFVLGALAIGLASYLDSWFLASPMQFGTSAVVIVVLCVVAFAVFRPRAADFTPTDATTVRPAPSPLVSGTFAFVVGSLFFGAYSVGSTSNWPAAVELAIALASAVAGAVWIARSARRAGWGPRHRVALAAGAVIVYCWGGFVVHLGRYGATPVGLVVQAAVVLLALALVALMVRGSARAHTNEPVDGAGAQPRSARR